MMALFLCCLTVTSVCADASSWAYATLNKLSLDEKIGQLLIPAVSFTQSKNSMFSESEIIEFIQKYHIGGCILLDPAEPQKYADLLHHLQQANRNIKNSIPLLMILDAEWGASMRIAGLDEIRIPFNLTLGAIQDNKLIYQAGKEVARQLKILGVHLNCAPVVDVNCNPNNPIINRRSFGQNPYHVAKKANYFLHGLQDAGIIACAKHFPGHGDTTTDSHVTLPVINHSIEQLQRTELIPFKEIINNGVMGVMSGHLLVPVLDTQHTASTSAYMLKNILRNDYAFEGLIITDGLDMQGILTHYSPAQAACKALCAGNDLLLIPIDIPNTIRAIKDAIERGKLSMEEIDQHVLRILQAKEWANQQCKEYSSTVMQKLLTNEAQELSKTLYAHAITLVKNENNLLPLSDKKKTAIIICGTDTETVFAEKMQAHADILYADTLTSFDIQEYDTVVFALYGVQYQKPPLYNMTNNTISLIHETAKQQTDVALILFGNPYALAHFKSVPTVLVAYEEHAYAQEAGANVMLGNLISNGQLPISV